jgi:hypothetical protein
MSFIIIKVKRPTTDTKRFDFKSTCVTNDKASILVEFFGLRDWQFWQQLKVSGIFPTSDIFDIP